MGQKLNNDVLTLLNMHYNAYCNVRKYADKYKHPHPTDTRGWSQIIVSALTGILGYERRKGPDLEDGSDVKAANCWDAIDTPRFNGCIKAGTQASTANSMLSLDEMPNLFFVMWDQSEATRQYRCRVWVVNTQTDPEFRKMAKRWYDQRASGVITSDNFQLQPPRNKDNNLSSGRGKNMPTVSNTYQSLYESLSDLREHLHLSGRMDDSNAKLDEVSKVIAVCIAAQNNWINAEEFNDLVRTSKHDSIAVDVLNRAFETCKTLPKFINTDGTSIFGSSNKLNIQTTDHEFALKLVRTIHDAFSRAVNHVSEDSSFDLINEAFGHFVRDNFRGNIEDAQYMTPPEVVDFICDWAISELALDGFKFNIENLKILDPSCGVGSFLASFYRKLTAYLNDIPQKINLIGQDKVDRMVRLSKINMMLFGSNVFDIEQGNSLIDSRRLDNLNGKIDLILTNPPFGANISFDKLNSQPKDNYPLLHGSYSTSRNVDSELAFIDRELALLKDGGKLFIVVPDSTISSRGLAETLRIRIQGVAKLKGVVELPSVAFAQAGTRTKTSILYLEKCTTRCYKTDLVTMATISDLGFQVSSRKGVAVKKYDGVNELVLLGEKLFNQIRVNGIVSETPSCTIETYANIKDASWTASHYSAKRVKAVKEIEEMPGFEARLLSELGECETKKRRRLKDEPGSKCISVLHIIGDGVLDFNELFTYEPKTKGNVCYEGDILLSKINPRIPRVIVIPELDFPTTCSNEFEIIRAREGIDPYWLCFMLLEKVVQGQIQSLTSGTSSSHNRIKTAELEMVKIPFPVSQDMDKRMKEAASRYRKYVNKSITALLSINELRQSWYKVYIPTEDRGNEVLSATACA